MAREALEKSEIITLIHSSTVSALISRQGNKYTAEINALRRQPGAYRSLSQFFLGQHFDPCGHIAGLVWQTDQEKGSLFAILSSSSSKSEYASATLHLESSQKVIKFSSPKILYPGELKGEDIKSTLIASIKPENTEAWIHYLARHEMTIPEESRHMLMSILSG